MDEKTKEALKTIFEKLTDEQKEKAKSCKTMNEFLEFAGSEGIELPDVILDSVAGGKTIDWTPVELTYSDSNPKAGKKKDYPEVSSVDAFWRA
ncbi:MAG: hypothetical protein J5832_06255 [Clostridia bacterium]|nr:hypothetical protein [Clostridia bacterium]